MPWLLLGLLALIAVLGVLRWAAYADIRQIKRALLLLGAAAALGIAIALALTGRFAAALPFVIPVIFAWRQRPRQDPRQGTGWAPRGRMTRE
ncbi:MAG: hypothetical protein D6782_12550, partial [Alphaproteobacteria bacterium]